MRVGLGALVSGLIGAFVACSNSSAPPPPIGASAGVAPPYGTTKFGGNGGSSGGTGGQDSGAGPCNTLLQEGTSVDRIAAPNPTLAPVGGTIAAGTYVLTKAVLYTGGEAPGTIVDTVGAITLFIDGTSLLEVDDTADGTRRENDTLMFVGADVVRQKTCVTEAGDAGLGAEVWSYDATSVQLTLAFPPDVTTETTVYTFTRK